MPHINWPGMNNSALASIVGNIVIDSLTPLQRGALIEVVARLEELSAAGEDDDDDEGYL